MKQVIFQLTEDTGDADKKRVIEWLSSRAVHNVRALFDDLDDPELSRILIADIEDEGSGDEILDWLNANSAVTYAEEEPQRKLMHQPASKLAVPLRGTSPDRNKPGSV